MALLSIDNGKHKKDYRENAAYQVRYASKERSSGYGYSQFSTMKAARRGGGGLTAPFSYRHRRSPESGFGLSRCPPLGGKPPPVAIPPARHPPQCELTPRLFQQSQPAECNALHHQGPGTQTRKRELYRITSSPLRRITFSRTSAAPVGRFAPRSNCET
jgi:hypothetical protein